MASLAYDNDAVDFSVDTSELESGKLDDDGTPTVLSPGSDHPAGVTNVSRKNVRAEEEGECPSDIENSNVEVESVKKSEKQSSLPMSADNEKTEDGELEEGECDDDYTSDNKTANRTVKAAIAANFDSTIKNIKQGVCVHFLKRTCTWGDNCRYLHPTPQSRNIAGYVLFEELEQAKQENKLTTGVQRRAGGPANANLPLDSAANSTRVPVHSRLGDAGLRVGGRAAGLLNAGLAAPNAFVPMPFSLPKQETAWEAGLRKVSETQSFVQKRRERAEDMQLGISSSAEDFDRAVPVKPTHPLLPGAAVMMPGLIPVAAESLAMPPIFAGNAKIPGVVIRTSALDDFAGPPKNVQYRQTVPENYAGRSSPGRDDLTITISNRSDKVVPRRMSPNSDLSDNNIDMPMRGGIQQYDRSAPSAMRRTYGTGLSAPFATSNAADFPPPPPHLQQPGNMPLNSDEQRRYERQLSHYFPSRKYYMNLDTPQESNSSHAGNSNANGGMVNNRFGTRGMDNNHQPARFSGSDGVFDRQAVSRSNNFDGLRQSFRANTNNMSEQQQDFPGPPSRRPVVNRSVLTNGGNAGEESALEIARRRHLERQRQQQQGQEHSQQERRFSRNNSNMSNISSSSREQSLDVVSDSEEKHLHRHKRQHVHATGDERRRSRHHNISSSNISGNNNNEPNFVGNSVGRDNTSTHSNSTFGKGSSNEQSVSPHDADRRASGNLSRSASGKPSKLDRSDTSDIPLAELEDADRRKRTLSSVSTVVEEGASGRVQQQKHEEVKLSHRQHSQHSPTSPNSESPASPVSPAAGAEMSANRKKISTKQHQQSLLSSKTDTKTVPTADTVKNNAANAARIKRQPVKLTINKNKRVRSSGAVFDDENDDDTVAGDADVVPRHQRRNAEDDSYESIGNSDDDETAAGTRKPAAVSSRAKNTAAALASTSTPTTISEHDREELLRQLRVIEEEIAAKRRRNDAPVL